MTKKKIQIMTSIISAVLIIVVLCAVCSTISDYSREKTEENYETTQITNGEYKLTTLKRTDDFGTFINFEVVNSSTNQIAFLSKESWHAYNVKSINFVGNSNDIRVDAGKEGKYLYRYHDSTWSVSTVG